MNRNVLFVIFIAVIAGGCVNGHPFEGQIDFENGVATGFCEIELGAQLEADIYSNSIDLLADADSDLSRREIRVCENDILVEVTYSSVVEAIFIKDSSYCGPNFCVRDQFRFIENSYPNYAKILTLEDGGIYSLYSDVNVSFVFDTDSIPPNCFVDQIICEETLASVELLGVFITLPATGR
ncbi:hypothetical protein [Ponticaulis koreensis]|uniref:hypothetical protein n=1 Tax=Ponticaulis koreensis TaxID=1123045 RepID=UPI0003B49584|nr:hypothetical protein [Ponticaulis koreensis]